MGNYRLFLWLFCRWAPCLGYFTGYSFGISRNQAQPFPVAQPFKSLCQSRWLFCFSNILKIYAFSPIFSAGGLHDWRILLVLSLEFQEVKPQPFSTAQPFPGYSAPPRPAGGLRCGLVAADLLLFDGRRCGLAGWLVFGEGGGHGDAFGAGFETGLHKPADFLAAYPGGFGAEDDRDEAGIAAPHGGNDIVAGSRDPAGFEAVGAGAGPSSGFCSL